MFGQFSMVRGGEGPARAMLLEEELDPDDDEETLDPAGEPDVLVSDDE